MSDTAGTATGAKDTPPVPAAKPPLFSWPPDRKVWAGGLGGVVAWGIIGVVQHYLNINLQDMAHAVFGDTAPDIQGILAVFVASAIAYLVPPAKQDIVKRIDNGLIKLANADQSNPTTAKIVSGEESDIETVKDARSGALPDAHAVKAVATIMIKNPTALDQAG